MIKSSLISASAGSGKTYTVTSEILKLLVHSYSKLGDILVTTFTKKAAQEIFERLITRILSAINSDATLSQLKKDLDFPDLTNKILKERLFEIIKNQHKIKIQTIDSFLVSLAQNFPRELSLPIGWKVADTWESQVLDKQIILSTLEKVGFKNLLLILPLVFKNQFSSKSFSAIEKELHKLFEGIALYDKEAWQLSSMNQYHDIENFDLDKIKCQLDDLVKSNIIGTQMSSAAIKVVSILKGKDWEEIFKNLIVMRVHGGDYTFNRKEIPEALVKIIQNLITHATFKLAKSIHEQSIGIGAIYSTFDSCRQELIRQNGLLTFNDINTLLSKSQIKNKLNEVYYKLDSKLNFVFIDEFQDTSASQWTILNPLVNEILQDNSNSRIFTAVGDSKQAIYGWRGGLNDIFGFIRKSIPSLEDRTLSISYRSQKHIIDFVNLVFTAPILPAEYNYITNLWTENFSQHLTNSLKTDGKIQIKKLSHTQDNSELLQNRLNLIKEFITEERKHRQSSKIGILTRTNKQALTIEKYLRDNKIESSTITSNLLTSYLEIQLIISCCTLALHPGDNLSFEHIKLYLINLVKSQTQEELSSNLLHKIYELGLTDFTNFIINSIKDHGIIVQADIDQLLYLAKGLERKQGNHISHFIKILDTSSTQNPDSSLINILTIHKSKGLEFDHVIIPFTKENFYKDADFYLLKEQDSPFDLPSSIIRNCKKHARPFISKVEELTKEARLTKISEALCLCYVAITRAKSSLSIIVDENIKLDNPSFASLLVNTISLDLKSENNLLFESGGYLDNYGEKEIRHIKTSEAPNLTIPAKKEDSILIKNIPTKSPSKLLLIDQKEQRLFTSINESSKLGIEIHSVLSLLKKDYRNLSELTDDFKEIFETGKLSEEAHGIITKFINSKTGSNIFINSDKQTRKIITEFNIAEILDSVMYKGRLDRIHIYINSSNNISKIDIFDFKLGKIDKDSYTLQLETYKRMVSKRFKTASDLISAELVSVL